MNTTTQEAFHIMRGHVADATEIKMNNGDTLKIKETMHGYDIYLDGREIKRCGHNAYAVESFIVNY